MTILFISYFVFLVGFAIFSASGLYHLWRFGYVGDLTKPVITTYIILVTLVIIVSITLILTHSWPIGIVINTT